MNLRDALLQGLATLPGSRELHVHVLASTPRKHSNLFPYATPRPKTFLQHILVLVSEQSTPDSPRVFVSAIEAFLYHLPTASTAVLYVSKVDSTGQAKAPSPTPNLVRALVSYYVDPTTRPLPAAHVWVHLFARAQNQYLFPNSADYPGKRPLTDMKLCAWWKRQLSMVAQDVAERAASSSSSSSSPCRIRLSYLLPGLGELEASHALDRAYAGGSATGTSVGWSYGHPYSEDDVPLPCCAAAAGTIGRGEKQAHIGHVIPWFDDDPKARFLDEIAYTTDADGVKSPERKRPRSSRATATVTGTGATAATATATATTEQAEGGGGENGSDKKEGTTGTERALKKVTVEEFWERMSFRQECVAGAVTGFFVMGTSCAVPAAGKEGWPIGPQPGQVSAQMVKRVLGSLMSGHEFPTVERAVWSTRVLEEAIRGLCEGLEAQVEMQRVGSAQSPGESQRGTPEPNGEGGRRSTMPETPRPRAREREEEEEEEAVPMGSLEAYRTHIYGSVRVANAEEPRRLRVEESVGVTVLSVRRKKRARMEDSGRDKELYRPSRGQIDET